MVLGIVGFVLSMGSLSFGFAFPFLFLNELMNVVARPLTQPTRYLVLALISLSILAAMGLSYLLREKSRSMVLVALFMVVCDAFLFGSMSLNVPTTTMPQFSCSDQLNGPVLMWPADATDGEMGVSQLLQIRHGQASAHTGIASWALIDNKRVQTALRGSGFGLGSKKSMFRSWLFLATDMSSSRREVHPVLRAGHRLLKRMILPGLGPL